MKLYSNVYDYTLDGITVRIPLLLSKKFYFFSLVHIRMSTKNIRFIDKKIKKREFYKNKKLFRIDHVDVNKILVSKITIRYKECA